MIFSIHESEIIHGSSMWRNGWLSLMKKIGGATGRVQNICVLISLQLTGQRVKKRSERLLSIALSRRLCGRTWETLPAIFYRLHSYPSSKNSGTARHSICIEREKKMRRKEEESEYKYRQASVVFTAFVGGRGKKIVKNTEKLSKPEKINIMEGDWKGWSYSAHLEHVLDFGFDLVLLLASLGDLSHQLVHRRHYLSHLVLRYKSIAVDIV